MLIRVEYFNLINKSTFNKITYANYVSKLLFLFFFVAKKFVNNHNNFVIIYHIREIIKIRLPHKRHFSEEHLGINLNPPTVTIHTINFMIVK